MIERWKHVILCALVLSAFGCSNVLADEYTLTEENQAVDSAQNENAVSDLNGWLSSVSDDDIDFDQYQEIMSIMYPELAETDEDELEDEWDVASPSTASRSDAKQTVQNILTFNSVAPASSYPSPDDGTISTTYLQYFKDMLVKLPHDTQYVFFRVDDYEYRMVYGDAINLSNNVFSGDALNYIRYYRTNNYNVWKLESGYEGSFRLTTNGYLVYSNVGDLYPSMNGGVYTYAVYACLFVLVLTLLFNLVHAFFFVGKYRI
ncbi:Uncharacterised protein [uncultured Clostridium sp.]|nr:Uncharacterised protein [uncultured Clostridium sp.]